MRAGRPRSDPHPARESLGPQLPSWGARAVPLAADPGAMRPRLLGLIARQHGLVLGRQATAHDLTPRTVARLVADGTWVRLRRGVYVDREVWAAADLHRDRPLLRLRAAHLVLELDHWFSHDSAAVLHRIGLLPPAGELVHVTRPRVVGDRTKAGIKHHGARFAQQQAVVVEELPCLDLARTAVDVAREHGFTNGVAACDAVLRRGVPRTALEDAAAAMSSWRHVRSVREIVAMADPGAANAFESAGRLLVLELGIGRPVTDAGLTDGTRTVWCDLRLGRHVFELDGRLKHRPPERGGVAADPDAALWAEKQRQDFVTGFRLGVSRITYADLFSGRAAAKTRLLREYADTCRRFGTDVTDLARYSVRRPRPL